MISSISVPICNRFHAIRASIGKITAFEGGTPLSRFRSKGSPSPRGPKFYHERVFVTAKIKNFVIPICIVLIRLRGVPDRRTDGRRTDASTMVKTRGAWKLFFKCLKRVFCVMKNNEKDYF